MSRRSSTSTMKLDGFSPGGTTRFESAISTVTPGPRTAISPVFSRASASCRFTSSSATELPVDCCCRCCTCALAVAICCAEHVLLRLEIGHLAGQHLLRRGRELVARQRAVPLHGADEADHRQRHRDRDAPGGRGAEAPSAAAGHDAHDGSPFPPRRRADQAANPAMPRIARPTTATTTTIGRVHDRLRRSPTRRTTPPWRSRPRMRRGPARCQACRHRTAGWRPPRPGPARRRRTRRNSSA